MLINNANNGKQWLIQSVVVISYVILANNYRLRTNRRPTNTSMEFPRSIFEALTINRKNHTVKAFGPAVETFQFRPISVSKRRSFFHKG